MGTRRTPGCRLFPSRGLHCSIPPRQDSCEFCGGGKGGWGRYLRSLPWPPATPHKSPLRPPPLRHGLWLPCPWGNTG